LPPLGTVKLSDMNDLPVTGTSLVMVVMSGALMVNTMWVISEGIAAVASPGDSIRRIYPPSPERSGCFSMETQAVFPSSPMRMFTVEAPAEPDDEPLPQPATDVASERARSSMRGFRIESSYGRGIIDPWARQGS